MQGFFPGYAWTTYPKFLCLAHCVCLVHPSYLFIYIMLLFMLMHGAIEAITLAVQPASALLSSSYLYNVMYMHVTSCMP